MTCLVCRNVLGIGIERLVLSAMKQKRAFRCVCVCVCGGGGGRRSRAVVRALVMTSGILYSVMRVEGSILVGAQFP